MTQVTFDYDGTPIKAEAKPGESLLQIGLEAGVPIEHACGGNGFCTTCMCTVTEGAQQLSELNDKEESMGIDAPERLTCQATVTGEEDVVVTITE